MWAGEDMRAHLIATIKVPFNMGYAAKPALNLPAPCYPSAALRSSGEEVGAAGYSDDSDSPAAYGAACRPGGLPPRPAAAPAQGAFAGAVTSPPQLGRHVPRTSSDPRIGGIALAMPLGPAAPTSAPPPTARPLSALAANTPATAAPPVSWKPPLRGAAAAAAAGKPAAPERPPLRRYVSAGPPSSAGSAGGGFAAPMAAAPAYPSARIPTVGPPQQLPKYAAYVAAGGGGRGPTRPW